MDTITKEIVYEQAINENEIEFLQSSGSVYN